jgi:O-antigen ligase
MDILIGLILIGYLILAIKRPDWAILAIIVGLPTYLIRFKLVVIPMTFLEAMILTSFAVWLLKDKLTNLKDIFSKKGNRQSYPFSWEIILVIIISWTGIISAGLSAEAFGVWKAYFFEPILFFILLFNLFPGETGRRKIIGGLAGSAAAVSVFCLYQEITGQFIANPFWADAATRRVVSFFGYPNAVGLFLGPLVMVFIGAWFALLKDKTRSARLKKIGLVLLILFSLLSILFAQSEGALFGLAGALFIFAFLANKKLRLVALSGAVLFLIATGTYQPLRHYVVQKTTIEDLSGQIRRQQWSETMKMLENGRLIIGAGLSNYQKMVKPYHQPGIFVRNDDPQWQRKVVWNAAYRKQVWQPVEIYMYPHNIFLNFWSEIGLAGALLFTWLIGRFLYQAWRLSQTKNDEDHYIALGLLGAMIVIVVNGLVDVPYFKNDLSVIFWIFFFLLGSLLMSRKKLETTALKK